MGAISKTVRVATAVATLVAVAVVFPDRNLSLSPASAASAGTAPCAQTYTTSTGSVSLSVARDNSSGDCIVQFGASATWVGTWTAPTAVSSIQLLVVGGGGGGGSRGAGGGGAGGYVESSDYAVTPSQTYDVKVGGGGVGGRASVQESGAVGTESFFKLSGTGVVANGGGAGNRHGVSTAAGGASGTGSGAGATAFNNSGGTGLESSTCGDNDWCGGGGGGAGGVGGNATDSGSSGSGGAGGDGKSSSISGASVSYAGGGGGGGGASGTPSSTPQPGGAGSSGGGGAGGTATYSAGAGCEATDGVDGTNSRGGGGGGSGYCDSPGTQGTGGDGGSGIVIIRYTPVPSAPRISSITAYPTSLLVSFSAPVVYSTAVTSYQVETSTNGTSWSVASNNVSSSATSYTITGLSPNTSYYVRIAAGYGGGLGAYGYHWQKIYDVDSGLRNGSSEIVYASGYGLGGSDAAVTHTGTAFTRVRYRMEATYGGNANYVDANFAKTLSSTATGSESYDSIARLRVPTTGGVAANQFEIHGDISDLAVESNVADVENGSGFTGRVEIWPWNYGAAVDTGLSTSTSQNSGTLYDDADSNAGSSIYGSFQLHRLSATPAKRKTIFAWNRHFIESSNTTPDIGFGTNTLAGSDSLVHPDWTFTGPTAGARSGFNLEIYVDVPVRTLATVFKFDAARASSYGGSGNTWVDLSGNGRDASIVGSPVLSTPTSSRPKGFTLDTPTAKTKYFTLGSGGLADFSSGITVQATVNFGVANVWERIIDFGNSDASDNILFAREGSTGHLVFEIYRGAISQGLCRFENGISANEFANYAVTLDASGNCQIYRNGSAQTTTWTAGAAKGLPNNITRSRNYIGKSNWTGDEDFGGVIRSVAVYSRVLTSAEIAANYDAEREFTITYDDNDATSGSVPASGTYTTTSFASAGSAATVAANSGSLAKTGSGFSGWNTTADASGTSYAAGGSYQTAADVTLYAIFNDTTAPTYQSGSVNAAGTQLTLTYSETLNATTAAPSAFVVKNVNIPNAVTAVAVSGSTVVLTLRETIYSGQTVTVAYTDPTAGNDANAIQDATGNDAATLSATSVTNGATAAVPAAARLIGLDTETLVSLTGPVGGIRGITSDGTKVYFRTSNDYTKMWEIPISSITANPNGSSTATATSWTITNAPSTRETTALAYSSGCIFVLDASEVLKCIDVTTRTATTVTVPAGKPLPTGQVWLTGSLIDFPDGRFGKVSAPTGSGSSYSSTLRLYTVSGTGSAATLTWSEDINLLDIESFPSDDHGIATDGTYLYRIQYASGYKVWKLRSGVDSSIIFNGNGSGSCAGSGTLCSINEPGTSNATYIAHDHAGNRYFIGDYSQPRFYMTEAQSPGPGPGSDSTPPSQPGTPDLVDGSDAGSSNTDNVTSVSSPTFSVTAAENGGTVTVTASKTGSSDVTCTMVGSTSGGTCQLGSLTNGTWSVSATHTDGSGNVSTTSSTLSVIIDVSAPSVTLAAVSATSTSTNIAFTLTGNENITCSTLSTVAGVDFALTAISSIVSIVQTSQSVCTVNAASTAAADGVSVASSLSAAGGFEVFDTAGNAQTTLTGSPQSVTVTVAAPSGGGGGTSTTSTSTTTSTTTTTVSPATTSTTAVATTLRPRATTTTVRRSTTTSVRPIVVTTTTTVRPLVVTTSTTIRSTTTTARVATTTTTRITTTSTQRPATTLPTTTSVVPRVVVTVLATTTTVSSASSNGLVNLVAPATTLPLTESVSSEEVLKAVARQQSNVIDFSVPIFVNSELPNPEPENPLVIQTGVEKTLDIVTINEQVVQLQDSDGFRVSVSSTNSAGELTKVNTKGAIVVQRLNFITVTGEGFKPNSDAVAWLFSEPRRLGVVRVRADGSFEESLQIGTDIPIGEHTTQVNGLTLDGEVRSLNLAVEVVEAGAISTSSRVTDTTIDPVLVAATGPRDETSVAVAMLALGVVLGSALTALLLVIARRRKQRS